MDESYQKEYLDSLIREEPKGRKNKASISVNIASTTTSPDLSLMHLRAQKGGEGVSRPSTKQRAEVKKKAVVKNIHLPFTSETSSPNQSPGRDNHSELTTFDKRVSLESQLYPMFPPSPGKEEEQQNKRVSQDKLTAVPEQNEKSKVEFKQRLNLGKSAQQLAELQAKRVLEMETSNLYSNRSSIISRESATCTQVEYSAKNTPRHESSHITPLISAKVTTTTFEGIRTTENSPIHGAKLQERMIRSSEKKRRISTQQSPSFLRNGKIELIQDLPAMGPLRYGYVQKKRSNLQITVLSERLERRMSMPSQLTPS